MDAIRKHAMASSFSLALVLAAVQVITPMFVDLILAGMMCGLVWVAGKLQAR